MPGVEEVTGKKVLIGERWTRRETLVDAGRRAATALDQTGVREGDAIALLIRNDPCYFEVIQASALLGAYVVPLNWHSTPDEIAYILSDCTPRAIIGHGDLIDRIAEIIPAGLPTFAVPDCEAVEPRTLPLRPHHAKDWASFRDQFAAWSAHSRAPRGTMIYTSGTTGRPKGVRRAAMNPEQVKKNVALLRDIYGIEEGMRAFVCGPLYHASPGAFARQAFQYADLTVLQHNFEPEQLLRTIAEHRITHLTMVPTMFVRLLRLSESVRKRYDISSIRWVTHTGAACPPDVKRQMIDWWGPVIHETYGATETGPAVGCDSIEWLAHPGTVGRPMRGTLIKIYGEDQKEVGAGGIGEIFLRTEAYSDFTYHGRPDQRQEIDRGGLVTCGDVGYLDPDGFLYICDRKRDMVISGGVNIYPVEIENILVNCPGVRDCAVFGVPDDEFGEALVAAIEAESAAELLPTNITAFLEQHLARFKVPKRFVFDDALPREASGKIFKRKLRDRYLQSTSARA
ncbi:MAG: long-chain fatty acid--CoA ligase [Bradyrhizobium sp.]|jgi:long-chain acyl-CoA synthetase|nr:long-chain fatty acid--CoA ligase [Bradyrhizobium sp.]